MESQELFPCLLAKMAEISLGFLGIFTENRLREAAFPTTARSLF